MTLSNALPGDHILEFIVEIERLEHARQAIADDIKEIFADVREEGFDAAAVRAVIAERKKAMKDDIKRRSKIQAAREYAEAIGQADLFG